MAVTSASYRRPSWSPVTLIVMSHAARGNRDPVQVAGQHDLAAERFRRLVGEPRAVTMFVALGEMGEHQEPRPGLGRDAPGAGVTDGRSIPA
jgi:hypothetical protein